jgi:two-component system, OmpR family, response regulator RstA
MSVKTGDFQGYKTNTIITWLGYCHFSRMGKINTIEWADMGHSPKIKILLVEDDLKLSKLIKTYLEKHGYIIITETHGDRVEDRLASESPDLIILDIMLPGLDGLSICKNIRPNYDKPILMLTALGDEIDEIVGLEIGADDYLAKPITPRLLLARIKTALRKASREPYDADTEIADAQVIHTKDFTINAADRSVRIEGQLLDLTDSEFDLLWLLSKNKGKILDRDDIYQQLRGIRYDGMDRSIDLRIARLRKKLGDDTKNPRIIKSVRGVGYLLVSNK